jgi:hypothetical protein
MGRKSSGAVSNYKMHPTLRKLFSKHFITQRFAKLASPLTIDRVSFEAFWNT